MVCLTHKISDRLANPTGYVKNLGWARSPDEFEFENPLFNLVNYERNLVLEIES